ncbi:MAG TPA: AAA family ATPase [Pirellulaceae bacterium]|jgi:exodeoxyribonuclease V alpha subunit|nr:AAA family ATPase [Pirellulaceae bacterium]
MSQAAERLSGEIERVAFHAPETGFCVLKVRVPKQADVITVTGRLARVDVGETFDAEGRWVEHAQFGRQFEAKTLNAYPPKSASGIEKYLAGGGVRGIGPQLAKRLVAKFGDQTLEVLESSPDFLLHMKGVGKETVKKIVDSWNEQRGVRDLRLFLAEIGIGGAGRAAKILKTLGSGAVAKIRDNPYLLAEEVRGVGFKTADAAALKLGIARDAPQRLRAGLMHVLADWASSGHCAAPRPELLDSAARMLEANEAKIDAALADLKQEGKLVVEAAEGDEWVYLTELYEAEAVLAEDVARLLTSGRLPLKKGKTAERVAAVQERFKLELAEAQVEALRVAATQKLLIVTGGPGVGKTTLVKCVIDLFEREGCAIALAAPTGRAAKRLTETTGKPAKTLHRLLEFDPRQGVFLRGPNYPLEGDLFVIDECSMLDVELAGRLFAALPERSCIVLVGDVDQLPSVGPGLVLSDLIESEQIPCVRLTRVFRQASGSRIVQAAHAVLHGEFPEPSPAGELSDFYFVEEDDPEGSLDKIVRLVRDRIPERFQLDPLEDVQVLSPMNKSLLGVKNLNAELQKALNPPEEAGDASSPVGLAPSPAIAESDDTLTLNASKAAGEFERFGVTFRVGDRVIQTVNNYDREVFNGDLGRIVAVDRVQQRLVVRFDGRDVAYDFSALDEISLAYAISVHKSQGSEFPCVVLPWSSQHFVMLERNLLYTAITRGKQLTVVVGSRRAWDIAMSRTDRGKRYSRLKARIRAAVAAVPPKPAKPSSKASTKPVETQKPAAPSETKSAEKLAPKAKKPGFRADDL